MDHGGRDIIGRGWRSTVESATGAAADTILEDCSEGEPTVGPWLTEKEEDHGLWILGFSLNNHRKIRGL
jgi:hypothetical protein